MVGQVVGSTANPKPTRQCAHAICNLSQPTSPPAHAPPAPHPACPGCTAHSGAGPASPCAAAQCCLGSAQTRCLHGSTDGGWLGRCRPGSAGSSAAEATGCCHRAAAAAAASSAHCAPLQSACGAGAGTGLPGRTSPVRKYGSVGLRPCTASSTPGQKNATSSCSMHTGRTLQ